MNDGFPVVFKLKTKLSTSKTNNPNNRTCLFPIKQIELDAYVPGMWRNQQKGEYVRQLYKYFSEKELRPEFTLTLILILNPKFPQNIEYNRSTTESASVD